MYMVRKEMAKGDSDNESYITMWLWMQAQILDNNNKLKD